MYEKLLAALSSVQDQITALKNTANNAYNDVPGTHQTKAAFIAMDTMSMDRSSEVLYLRHDQRVVISAPEVVIGNVTRDGLLMTSEGSKVSIRSNEVKLNGVGDGGRVETKAPVILGLAVDPGMDGAENRVCDNSAVVSHARKISLESSNTNAKQYLVADGRGRGLYLHSDSQLSIDASRCNKDLSADIGDIKALVSDEKDLLTTAITEQLGVLESLLASIKGFQADKNNDFFNLMFTFKSGDVEKLHANIEKLLNDYAVELKIYFDLVSRLCELNYQEKALDADKEAVDSAAAYADNTDCALTLNAESVVVSNFDGDGTFRNNKGAGFSVLSNKTQFSDNQLGGSLQAGSSFIVNSKNIEFTGHKSVISDNKNTLAAEGTITLNSKRVRLRSLDYAVNNNDARTDIITTAESSISARSENINIRSVDSPNNEGVKKSTGAISLTAKNIQIRSVDVSNGTESLSDNGTVAVVAKDVVVGSRDIADNIGNQVTVQSNTVNITGKTQVEVIGATETTPTSMVQLNGTGASIGSAKTQITSKGEIAVSGEKVTLAGPVTAGSVKVDSLNSSSALVAPNIKDGTFKADKAAAKELSQETKKPTTTVTKPIADIETVEETEETEDASPTTEKA